MGDMADLILDQADEDFSTETRLKPACRYCGQPNLRWRELVVGWRLFDGNEMHVCPVERKSKGEKKVTKFKTFWILWQPGAPYPPKVRFEQKKDAEKAAEIMTTRHKAEFYVMKADGLCQLSAPPIKWSGRSSK